MSVPGSVTFQVPTSGLLGFGEGVVVVGFVVVVEDGTGVVVLVVVVVEGVVGFAVVDGFVVGFAVVVVLLGVVGLAVVGGLGGAGVVEGSGA